MRWVLKAAPRQIGSGWLARNEDGIAVTTKSGALRVLPTSSTSATAIFSDGSAWSDVFLKARVAHHGGTLRLRVRNTDLAHYAAEISASGVRLLRVTNGVETTLAQRALAYPGDEFLFVELGVVGQMLRLSVDTISIFDDVATGGAVAAGTIALEALNSRSASQAVEFDDVQVVRVTKLWAEAETLLAEPFTASLPANWTFKTAGMPWAIDPGGHERLDLRSLQNLTLKIDYAHEMVESPS
jgi:hypothetical protein